MVSSISGWTRLRQAIPGLGCGLEGFRVQGFGFVPGVSGLEFGV